MWGHTCLFSSRRLSCSQKIRHFFSVCSDHSLGTPCSLPVECHLSSWEAGLGLQASFLAYRLCLLGGRLCSRPDTWNGPL